MNIGALLRNKARRSRLWESGTKNMTKPSPDKDEGIAMMLLNLSEEMRTTAREMKAAAAGRAVWLHHVNELRGAARLARQWAKMIVEDAGQ